MSREVPPPKASSLDVIAPLALTCALVAAFVARARIATTLNINWDEFFFLTRIHSYVRGELSERLLTFHVHLLSWVPGLGGSEVDQVVTVRGVMLACGVVGALCTVYIGWRVLGSVTAGLFAAFTGQSLSFVLQHGQAARYDPMIVALFLVAAALLVSERKAAAPLAGVAVAVALAISIKAALYVPSLLGLLALRAITRPGPDARRAALVDIALFLGMLAVAGALLYGVHALSLADPPPPSKFVQRRDLSEVIVKALRRYEFPIASHFIATLRYDTPFWAFVLLGVCVSSAWIGQGGRARIRGITVILFVLPLVAVAVYRNSYAYFYVCVVPPAALAAAALPQLALELLGRWRIVASAAVIALVWPCGANAYRWVSLNSMDELAGQRAVVAAVHQIFPEPTRYIDRCGMIAGFEKVGPFMSTWGTEEYRKRKQPIMRGLIEKSAPLLLLQNVETLDVARISGDSKAKRRLLPEDYDVLRDNYVPYWGPVWVAGKLIVLLGGDSVTDFEILMGGDYVVRVESRAPPDNDSARVSGVRLDVILDGVPVASGATVALAAGKHTVASADAVNVELRTAAARAPPSAGPPLTELFRGFKYKGFPKGRE